MPRSLGDTLPGGWVARLSGGWVARLQGRLHSRLSGCQVARLQGRFPGSQVGGAVLLIRPDT